MTAVIRKRKGDYHPDHINYTVNPYTGCCHGCVYCYSTKSKCWTSRAKKWNKNPEQPTPKENVLTKFIKDMESLKDIPLNEKILQIGNFADVYQPIEKEFKITRSMLILLLTEHPEWEVHIMTKSDLILRDIDILKRMKNIQVEITITTLTHDKQFEPNVSSSEMRLKTVKELSDNGIFVRVIIVPVLKGYTDVEAIKKISTQNGAKDFIVDSLHESSYKDLTLEKLEQKYGIHL